jgi:hypothetical protein
VLVTLIFPPQRVAGPFYLHQERDKTAMADQGGEKPHDPVSQLKIETKSDAASSLETKWNTKNLAFRLAADLASAASAAVLVAPLISIIDRFVSHSQG